MRDNIKSFIYTNPPKDTKLSPKDKIFVLKIFQECGLGKQDKRPDFSDDSVDSWVRPESPERERTQMADKVEHIRRRDKENVMHQEQVYKDIMETKTPKINDKKAKGVKEKVNRRAKILRNKKEANQVTEILRNDIAKIKKEIEDLLTEFPKRNEAVVKTCIQRYRDEKKKLQGKIK